MKSDTNILLERLRRQPRHGRVGETPEEAQAKSLQSQLENLEQRIPNLTSLYTAYSNILSRINNDNAQYSQGLGIALKYQESYKTNIVALYKSITALEEANSDLAKSFGLNSANGQKLADKIRGLAESFGIGDEKLFAYAKSLRELSGGMLTSKNVAVGFGKQMMQARQVMINNMSITDEAADGFELYAAGMGKSGLDALGAIKEISNVIEKSNIGQNLGLDALSLQKDLTSEIGSLTADLQMRYNKIPGSLELAVLKSKALGLNMRDLNSAGDNLLNIESSIGQELEYQLLSGKRLLTKDKKSLTDAYRRATLEGDANKQAELMNHLLEEQGDVLKTNMFARKKAAELMGMDEAALARSIQKREILQKLGAEDLMSLSADKFEGALKDLQSKIGKDPERQQLFNDLLKATDQRTTAERSEDLLEQIQSNTRLLASKNIKVGELQKTLVSEIKDQKGAGSFRGLMETFDPAAQKIMGQISNIGKVAETIRKPLSELISQFDGIGRAIDEALKKLTKVAMAARIAGVKDTLIVPDKGPILRPAKNDVIAAFRPGDVIDRTLKSSTSTSSPGGIDYAKLAMAMKSQPIDYTKLAMAMKLAMSEVKVEATVKTDTLYAGTKLNGPRRFGQG